jgi:hypothetical protein
VETAKAELQRLTPPEFAAVLSWLKLKPRPTKILGFSRIPEELFLAAVLAMRCFLLRLENRFSFVFMGLWNF